MTPQVIVSCGDVNGIGLRCLSGAIAAEPTLAANITLVIDRDVLEQARVVYGISLPVSLNTIYSPCKITPGIPATDASRLAIHSLDVAFAIARESKHTGVTTLPINKHALKQAGWPFLGQTEMAASYATGEPLMVLSSGNVRVALNTAHVPLSEVSSLTTISTIYQKLQVLHQHLTHDVGLSTPRIAVLSLNPHASEGGEIGTEDITIVAPAIELAKQDGYDVQGPFAADGFFGFGAYTAFDGILAMYHDQGLIPLKLLSKGAGVNLTAGLSFVRTSPDHGTAYDRVTSADIDHTSTLEALHLCLKTITHRAPMA